MNYKEYAKTWIDQNVHDGEDRSGWLGQNDRITFDPNDLQELVDDLLDDLIPKAMEEQRKACAYEFMQHMRLVNFEYRGDKYTLKQAILNATIEDKDNGTNIK